MPTKIKLISSISSIEKDIKREVFRSIRNKFRTKKLQEVVRREFELIVRAHPTIQELQRGGTLAADFGIRRGEESGRIDNIISLLLSSIDVKIINDGDFKVQIVGADNYESLISIDAGTTFNKGEPLPWLEWLLLYGDRTIIEGYRVETDNGPYGRSRSGQAIMVQSTQSFSVDPEYAGTRENNFITQSIDTLYNTDVLHEFFIKELKRVLK